MKKLLLALILALSTTNALAYSNADVDCMSKTIFYEANMEPLEGKVAVGYVLINRAESSNKSICSIIKEPGQFTWYQSGKLSQKIPVNYKELARNILDGMVEAPATGIEYFHRTLKFRPKWTKNLEKVAVIGHHTFYRERNA